MQTVRRSYARSAATNGKTPRSAITNGKRLLEGISMRTAAGRRYRDLVEAYTAEIGGELSQTEMAMVKQAAALAIQSEAMQADIVNRKPVDTDALIRISGTAKRILDALRDRAGKRKLTAEPSLLDLAARRAAERANPQAEGAD